MKPVFSRSGYTLPDLLTSMLCIGVLGSTLVGFTFGSSRSIARNLSTNHSHEAIRTSQQSFLAKLKNTACAFQLVDYDGSSFTDVLPTRTGDQDVLTKTYASNRTNGVRFRLQLGKPVLMTSSTTPTTTTLKFQLAAGAEIPLAGDKLALPLISREFDIASTSVSGTVLTVNLSSAVGFTLNAASPNQITAVFYRRCAYVVFNNELRYHPQFFGPTQANYEVLRKGCVSPEPFALLYATATSPTTDSMAVRVSMEFTDMDYSNQRYNNSTSTLYTVITARNQNVPLRVSN